MLIADQSVGFLGDLQNFIRVLDGAFQAESGGDCPEYSYCGIREALNTRNPPLSGPSLLQRGSQIIVLTDAPNKGALMTDDLIRIANAVGVCVHFFLGEGTYNCFADQPGSVLMYKSIASATGGTVVKSDFEFASFVSAYNDMPCSYSVTSAQQRGKRAVVEDSNCQRFRVSTLARLLKLSVMTDEDYVTVTSPDGMESRIDAINRLVATNRVGVYSKVDPLPGEWTACVAKGSVSATVDVEVTLDITPLYFVLAESGATVSTATPPPGCESVPALIFKPVYMILDHKPTY